MSELKSRKNERTRSNHTLSSVQESTNRSFGQTSDKVGAVNGHQKDCSDNSYLHSNNRQRRNEPLKKLKKKQFIARDSILTELFRSSPQIESVYNIFIAVLVIIFVQALVCDTIEAGRLWIDLSLVTWGCGKLHLVIIVWLMMMTVTLIAHPVFMLWAACRSPNNKVILDSIGVLSYLSYLIIFTILPMKFILDNYMPPISTSIVVLEQIRMMMKVHSFLRENVPLALSNKTFNNVSDEFSRYLYFLFAPVLIYRDQYPRTKTINWRFVFTNMLQVVFCIFYVNYVFKRYVMPTYSQFGKTDITLYHLMSSYFGSMVPAELCLLFAFFAVLHSWLNACAEMSRFADRLFYEDFWNATTMTGYYRTWNVVVHDWIYSYIYIDIYQLIGMKRSLRGLIMYITFFLSAVVHEYILTMIFKCFYPILFVKFAGCGVAFIFLTEWTSQFGKKSNIVVWIILFVGMGGLMCVHSIEWYARVNCPRTINSFYDYLVPRSWFCEPAAVRTNQNTTTG